MRIHIVGKDPEKINNLKNIVAEKNFECVEENPELVICYGGDGMFLISERIFPGVPKLLIRDSDVGNNCHNIDLKSALEKYLQGEYTIKEIKKLKAKYKGKFETRELIAVNDIVVRNSLPTEAIRFHYRINGEEWSNNLIGDGIIVATSYGSTKGAYFYSITQKSFSNCLALAFNNTTEKIEPIFLKEKDIIEIQITRGLGVLVSDNNRDFINLENGDTVKINLTNELARRVVLE